VANTRAPGGQLGWHVQYVLAVGDQPLGDVPADAIAAFHRPQPVWVSSAQRQHHPVAVGVRAESALRQYVLALVDDLDGRGPLVRVHPDDDRSHIVLLASAELDISEDGNASSSWADPSGATPRRGDRRAHAK
jgi:hypothetical protein